MARERVLDGYMGSIPHEEKLRIVGADYIPTQIPFDEVYEWVYTNGSDWGIEDYDSYTEQEWEEAYNRDVGSYSKDSNKIRRALIQNDHKDLYQIFDLRVKGYLPEIAYLSFKEVGSWLTDIAYELANHPHFRILNDPYLGIIAEQLSRLAENEGVRVYLNHSRNAQREITRPYKFLKQQTFTDRIEFMRFYMEYEKLEASKSKYHIPKESLRKIVGEIDPIYNWQLYGINKDIALAKKDGELLQRLTIEFFTNPERYQTIVQDKSPQELLQEVAKERRLAGTDRKELILTNRDYIGIQHTTDGYKIEFRKNKYDILVRDLKQYANWLVRKNPDTGSIYHGLGGN